MSFYNKLFNKTKYFIVNPNMKYPDGGIPIYIKGIDIVRNVIESQDIFDEYLLLFGDKEYYKRELGDLTFEDLQIKDNMILMVSIIDD